MKNTLLAPNALTIENITKAMIFHGGEPFATSTQIAKYFGIGHKNLLQKIRSFHSYNELISQLKIQPRNRTIRGKNYPYFELDADAFVFTCMSFTGKKAESFKWVFIKAFKLMAVEALTAKVKAETNKTNELWGDSRNGGKITRKSLTDTIKKFCMYAEDQRGDNYKTCPFYKLVNDAIYSFLEVDIPKGHRSPRDVYSGDIIEAIEVAELHVIELLNEIMNSEGSRKGIKSLIVDRLTHEMGNFI